ncbi:MAG TPA: DUF1109 domain-containing protein [Ramlibacter sp.]|nr:DUF1109 domain-containing protein [Ramlibacter sp.]
MRTDELVAALAADAAPVDNARAERRFRDRLLWGPAVAIVLMLLLLGPRPDLAEAMRLPLFWLKAGLPAVVAAASWLALYRLGHPGLRLGRSPAAALAPMALVSLAGALVLWNAAPAERPLLLFGQTWRDCLVNVSVLALPALALALWALRGMAPTRLVLAGAAAGLFAGAAGAFAYAFHCPELELPFLGAWYVAGMLIPTALGALVGRRLLRW